MEQIKEGQIVALKSDDKALFTVGYYNNGDRTAWVYWYDHTTKSLKSMEVPIAILQS